MTRSIHDNVVYAYRVECQRRRIVLHTEFSASRSTEYTDVHFDEVVAHYFENESEQNILFGVEEVDLATLLRSAEPLFVERKKYWWPRIEWQTLDDLIAKLIARNTKAYEISTSLGLGGWVLGGSMGIVPRASRQVYE